MEWQEGGGQPDNGHSYQSSRHSGNAMHAYYMPTLPDYLGVSQMQHKSPGLSYRSTNLQDILKEMLKIRVFTVISGGNFQILTHFCG